MEFYIKYQNNGVVAIDTAYDAHGRQRDRPFTTVGHLIAAFFRNTPPNELAQYSLHSIINGEETSYNSWDPLTVLGDNGSLGTNPLIVKSRNEMEDIQQTHNPTQGTLLMKRYNI